MPSSLIIVALVVAWLVVLVPMAARKRQEVAKTADSAPAEGVVRSGSTRSSMEEEYAMPDAGETDTELNHDEFDDDYFDDEYIDVDARPFRPGRGGFDPETAAMVAQAKYAFRRRVVGSMLLAALLTGLVAGLLYPIVWWGHAAVDLFLVGYLVYLRRQVRMEEEIRARRHARLAQTRRRSSAVRPQAQAQHEEHEDVEEAPTLTPPPRFEHHVRPGTVVVDADDEDPVFVDLAGVESLPYRRAVGE
ncbi:MAG TPA: gephyrin-like molybdotransferase receptor GlpR [Pseudonocardiaceae bacterium]|jgi:hypothetical protein|nr:gephyrin-like molybdotransferase receptor GlpR [Pseudonocardiaceae bacterium]